MTTALRIKELVVGFKLRTRAALMRKLTTEANTYSRAVANETKAKDVKATSREKLIALMETLGEETMDLTRFRVLVLEKGGDLDHALATQHLDENTLAELVEYRIDEELAEQHLDAETLAKIRVPVINSTLARKKLGKETIKVITVEGTTTTAINVNPIRAA